VLSLFFFFQAEDGIRDRNVTGVQTCALPISITTTTTFVVQGQNVQGNDTTTATKNGSSLQRCTYRTVNNTQLSVSFFLSFLSGRSEERRVGKECRCRWSRYQCK